MRELEGNRAVRSKRVISVIDCHAEGEVGDVTIGNVPAFEGRAWITGRHACFPDPEDPYPQGYVVPGAWGLTGTLSQ